ncbi:Transcriptional regulator [Gaiella occulta]|uniref:Transcriptional regulator n=1 Tax=Gaiella occulta TaxID=1002870 RepID=A0A7M2Z163_9ACTN|nr:TetR family transcriptional regulator C-terminal domain-containing protein [Gaiella occulta]RDI75859.1 Transcriptional regulator [Gaiella occulta]
MTTATQPQNERITGILEAACRVIVREGAHGLRMARVAEEAGVSKALVHYYFSTRQELLRHAFAYSEERWHAAVSAELIGVAAGSARVTRALLVSVEPEMPFSEQRALWNEVWSSLRSDDELRPLVERSYRAWLDRIVTLIEEGQGDGSVPADVDATQAGWRLAAVADGLDSLLYLGLVDRDGARALMHGSIERELAGR